MTDELGILELVHILNPHDQQMLVADRLVNASTDVHSHASIHRECIMDKQPQICAKLPCPSQDSQSSTCRLLSLRSASMACAVEQGTSP